MRTLNNYNVKKLSFLISLQRLLLKDRQPCYMFSTEVIKKILLLSPEYTTLVVNENGVNCTGYTPSFTSLTKIRTRTRLVRVIRKIF